MKKIYAALACTALAGAASAQQLPNVGFGEWKTECDSTQAFGYTNGMLQRPGIEPAGWNGSSVHQNVLIAVQQELVFRVGELDEAHADAARLTNKFVGMFGIGSVAPGFVNFGTPWVQADFTVDDCDGGTFGGLDFTWKPDELQLDVKRIDSNDEVSSVVAYLWNGEFRSLTGTISNPTHELPDVDRAIVGRAASVEGSTGTYIGGIDYTFTSTDGEWTTLTLPFEYVSDATPEKLNVIVCGGDYWNRANLKEDTELYVNNIKLIYHSRLASLDLFGEPLEGFDPDVYEYEIDEYLPMTDEIFIEPVADGHNASITYDYHPDDATVIINVTNVGEDNDGLTGHSYVLSFKKAAESDDTTFDGKLTIEMAGSLLTPEEGMDAHLIISRAEGADVCTITLPDFVLDLGNGPAPLGDIVVTDVAITEEDGKTIYNGAVEGLSLLGGAIVADVTLTGTQVGDVAEFDILVMWSGIEITCHFKSGSSAITVVGADNAGATEVYDLRGVRVSGDNLPAGVYIRRQGAKTEKFIVR